MRWPALAGLMLGVAYLPGPFLPLNLTCFVPLLFWIDARREATAYERLRAGLLFGVVAEAVAMHWMYSLLTYSWLAALLYVGVVIALALRLSLSVVLLGWLRRKARLGWAIALPLSWLPLEWAQSWGDLRLTGDHLAYTLGGYPFLLQFADVVGPYGVTAVLLAVNGLVATAIRGAAARPERRRAIVGLVLLVATILGYDVWAWNRELPADPPVRVGIVQPNASFDEKGDPAHAAKQWETLVRLSQEAARQGAELIVWPETARPLPLYHWLDRPETYSMADVQALAKGLGVPLVVGVEYVRLRSRDDHELYNAALGVDERGELLDEWGAKVYLVPFSERLPFERLLGPFVGRGGAWRWVAGGFEPASHSALLELAGTKVGVLVCYEQLFAGLARRLADAGAELQVVITNDVWFGRSLFQRYNANALRLRAIENRTPFVRAANPGISGVIDPKGRYIVRTALFEEAVSVVDVRPRAGSTPYRVLGDLAAWLAVGGLALAGLSARGGSRLSGP